jgi:homoserine dehydrogenase
MTNPIKLGIAGLGTVGIGVVKIIQQKAETLQAQDGQKNRTCRCFRKNKAKRAWGRF